MDDPLRPKTVPLSAETILWFEFLLDPSLLAVHLAKDNAIPTAVELISKFLSITQESQTNPAELIPTPDIESSMNKNEGLKIGRKQLALKILGLKVASHLKWNLQILEKSLPLYKQVQLLSDLCSVTSGKTVNLPLSMVHECQLGPNGSKKAFNFALTLYHRWVLRTQLLKDLPQKPAKQGFNHLIAAQDHANTFRDEMIISSLEPFTKMSIDFLIQICQDPEDDFIHLTYDSFIALSANISADNTSENFSNVTKIQKAELKAQIYYDLCQFYLHDKKYSLAKENILECRKNLELLGSTPSETIQIGTSKQHEFLFCSITDDELNGCLMACGVFDETKMSLLHQMSVSVFNEYKDIVEIFKNDNIKNEIPLVNRKIIELDMDGAHTLGKLKVSKETIIEVAALNVINALINEEDLFAYSQLDYVQKYQKHNGFTILVNTTAEFIRMLKCNTKKNKLIDFFKHALYIMVDEPKPSDIETLVACNLFTKDEINQIKEVKKTRFSSTENMELPQICTMTDWKMSDSKLAYLEIGAIKRQIVNCSSATTVRKLLVRLVAILAQSKSEHSLEPWNINPNWIMPIHIKTVLMSLPRGFCQDFMYILVAKSKEMAMKNDFKSAITMLNAVKSEIQRKQENIPVKLSKLIDHEILLFQISQNLEDWPKRCIENQIMINKCKQCLSSNQSGDNIVSRVEILDACAAMLINLNETSGLISSEKRFPSSDLYLAVANAIVDLEHYKAITAKKVCREAWDLVLAMFSTNAGMPSSSSASSSQGGKRNMGPSTSGSIGSGGISHVRDSPTIIVSTSLSPFLKKLRDPLPVTIMLSLLARLHNILDDEANMELNIDYMYLWPNSVSNASGYSKKAVTETLNNFLKQSLSYYPNYVSWIRLKGDLEFRNENYEAAISSYITAIVTGSEYCTVHLHRQIDDYIIRRMIKCATNLGCYMQAYILCQFLEEVDYSLAFKTISERSTFKNLSERSTYFSDAIDSYYNCIWDPTLLEYIVNLQHKKGEHKRKQQAISIIGQLELNGNNNEEIKREAANSRRIKFLRALAKQYMMN